MKNMFQLRLAPALLAGLTALSLTACGAAPAAESAAPTAEAPSAPAASGAVETAAAGAAYDGKVVLAHSSWIGFVPLDLAAEKGFFKDHGADVEIQYIESKSDSKSALAAGKIQGIATSLDTVIMSSAAGIDSQVVLAMDTSSGGDGLIAKDEYKSFTDLKGKTIALDTTGGASFFWFNYLLKQEGLTADDFDVQSMGSGDAGAAFVAGQVDAAMTWQPWLDKAEDTDFGGVLLNSKDYPGIIVDALCLDTQFVADYPATVQAIVDGWYDALDYMKSDPDDAYAIMDKALGNDDVAATQTSMENEVTFYDEKGNLDYFGTPEAKGEIYDISDFAAQLWVDTKMVDAKADIDHVLNGGFLKRTAG